MLELYVLIGIIVLLGYLLYDSYEGFAEPDTINTYVLDSCPNGYDKYNDKTGAIMCCSQHAGGINAVSGKLCTSQQQCSLSASPVASCASVLAKEYKEKSVQCPASMPSYYEGKVKGCTNGLLNKSMTGPANAQQPSCKIYDTLDDNLRALDSCSNSKEMDEYPCFGDNCSKSLTQNETTAPVLITVSFTDKNGIQRLTHTRDSMRRFMDHTKPKWRDTGFDLNKNISITEVAKAYYIDKTLSQDDIQN